MKSLAAALFLALAALPIPAAAGLLSIDVNGVLGPVLQGSDPIHLAGDTFTATGSIDPNAVPISTSTDAAIYLLSGDLQVLVSNLTLTGYDAMITVIAPPSGPDTVVLDFSVLAYSSTPDVTASFTLPAGTFDGTGIQTFWEYVNEPGGSLGYSVPGATSVLTGTLGITGSVSVGGTPSSSAPEPGTAGLLALGTVVALALKMRGREGQDGSSTYSAEKLRQFRARYPNKKVTIGGVQWNYRICGEGPRALLMLPGGLGNDLAFGLVSELVSQFRVVYPAYPQLHKLADAVEGIAAILTAENIASVSVFGASTGGAVAQCFVRRYPGRVERLILSNTGVPTAHCIGGRRAVNSILPMIPWPLLRVPLARGITKLLNAPAADRPFWRAYAKELFTKHLTKAVVLANLRLQLEYQEKCHFSPDDLAVWPGQVFIVESDNDIFSAARRKAMLDTYPQAPVYTIHGGGHMPAFTRTGEYLEVLDQFLPLRPDPSGASASDLVAYAGAAWRSRPD